ncbi:O-antigen ligase family protein [Mycoplasmatota bacterium]|nr:O-antigen ligase family protein [Mycoplasmatota bacterium]
MQKFEKYLASHWHIFTVFIFALIIWTIKDPNQNETTFGLINMIGMFVIILSITIILSLYRNTLYTIPLYLSLIFVVNNSQMTFNTLNQLGFPYVVVSLVILGPIINIIRFRPSFKIRKLTLGLFLITLAYMISYLMGPLNLKGLAVSGISILYFLLYVFFSNTTKGDINYLFKILLSINLLLSAQLGIKIYEGLMAHTDLSIIDNFTQGSSHSWYSNFGWANINDMNFYIALTLPSIGYFIFKHPKNIIFWLLLLIPSSVIILSGSRGGAIGYLLSLMGLLLIVLWRGKQRHYIHAIILLILVLGIAYLSQDVLIKIYETFIASLQRESVNSISSSRIYIYDQGLLQFRSSPIFGKGWLSVDNIGFTGRIFMYHSTIIQVLATMGLFGLFALLVHYYQIFNVLYDHFTLEKQLIFIGYIATQLHGLLDNVQFSVPYSLIIVMIFPIIETAKKQTVFKKEKRKYTFDV